MGYDNNAQTVTALTTAEMKISTNYSGWDFDSTWGIINDSTYPALLSVSNNAPFAFADTINVAGSVELSTSVLYNDYDYETGQDLLICKIISTSTKGSISNGVYSFNVNTTSGTQETITYCVGELIAESDTLWGNYALAILSKVDNTAPTLSDVNSNIMDEDASLSLSLDDVTVNDAENDVLSLVIIAGDDYSFNGTTITPTADFNGTLKVPVYVSDGEFNSDTLDMDITVNAVNDAPVVTAVATDLSVDEDNSITLSLSNVTASDVDNNELTLVISNGDNYTVAGYIIKPTADFNGTLHVPVYVSDGELNSDTIAMTITVIAVPDTPIITWESPEPGVYGTAIGSDAMDASANNNEGNITYSFAADSIFDAGTYELIATYTPNNSDDYTATSDTVKYTVNQLPITVIASANQTKVYGESDPTLTYALSADLIDGNVFSGTLSRDGGEDVATYAITQGDLALNANYALTFESADFEITAKPITVIASANQTKTYGESDSTLTYTLSADLIDGEVFSGTLSREEGEDVGTYAITLGDLSAGSNYNVTFETADLTISTKAITVTVDANQTKTYGESDPTLTYALSADLIDGDAFSGTLSRDEGEDAGTYAITQGDLSAGSNYDLSFESADFTITQAELTATADDQAITQGAEMPEFTITYSGFVNGDTESDLDELPTATTTATLTSDAGEYAITVAGGSDNNYYFSYVEGILIISSSTAISELSAETISVYPNPATTTLNVSGSTGIAYLYNLTGKLLLSQDLSQSNSINLSALPNSIYMLSIEGKNIKVVKQ
jgi:hypothetical protein